MQKELKELPWCPSKSWLKKHYYPYPSHKITAAFREAIRTVRKTPDSEDLPQDHYLTPPEFEEFIKIIGFTPKGYKSLKNQDE